MWWRQGALPVLGAGCARGGDRVPVLGSGCAHGADRVSGALGTGAGCSASDSEVIAAAASDSEAPLVAVKGGQPPLLTVKCQQS